MQNANELDMLRNINDNMTKLLETSLILKNSRDEILKKTKETSDKKKRNKMEANFFITFKKIMYETSLSDEEKIEFLQMLVPKGVIEGRLSNIWENVYMNSKYLPRVSNEYKMSEEDFKNTFDQ